MELKRLGRCIGLVPTMGCLHQGHLSLIKTAKARADITVLSVFVNPTQFAPNEDFKQYPRTLRNDAALCRKAGVDILFAPKTGSMYDTNHSVFVDESRLSKGLCGASRPGHFQGVLTVVAKLFNICQPNIAVFGRKDAQQARLIIQLVKDLNFFTKVVLAPIVREPDGLAISSRNRYLNAEERSQALSIYRGLKAAQLLYKHGEARAPVLLRSIRRTLEPASLLRIDYLEAVNAQTLEPVKATIKQPILLALAAYVGTTRLIDNILLTQPSNKHKS